MKILVSDSIEKVLTDVLTQEGFEVDNRPGISPEDLKAILGEYDALVVRSATQVTADVIGSATTLKVIGRAGTGVDNIDTEAATRKGILVMNTPGGNTISAAEHTVSMLLAMARNIPQAHISLAQGKWEKKRFIGTEVFDKTIGIVGLGKIGREVGARCQGLGMKVVGYDPVLAPDVAMKLGIEPVSLDELFRRSDFISFHTPLTAETKGLLNDSTIARCKRGVRILNCARGGIVDEQALLRGLESGHVSGAALDVFENEPPSGNPLLRHEHVIATPHLGASTEEAQEKVALQIAQQVADALKGRGYAGVVNGLVLPLTTNEEVRPYLLLAERIGSLVAQLTLGRVKGVTIGASGDLVGSSLDLLKAGILKGILSHLMPEPVNVINAPLLAQDMGLIINEQRERGGGDFPNMVRVRYRTERDEREVAGTVFGSSTIRLVQMDGFRFEIRPEGHLLVYNNVDRPGMLARVGSILAGHKVNIAGVSLGRASIGQNALTVMNIDSDVPPEALKQLHEVDGVSNLRVVRLT